MPTVVGHCVNLLPIRTAIDWQGGFAEYLAQVRSTMLDAFDHQNFTYGELVRALNMPRDADRLTLMPVVFNIDNGIDLSTIAFGETETEFVTNPRRHEHFELYLNLTDSPDEVRTEWSYAADLFDARDSGPPDRTCSPALLERICEDDGRSLGALTTPEFVIGCRPSGAGPFLEPGGSGVQDLPALFAAIRRRSMARAV